MSNPQISVIMGVYNGAKYLKASIDSILNQSFTDFEYIIINDGSTDNTSDILESYNDRRLKIIEQKNIGLTKSLNKAIKLSKGVFIARQDADDISKKHRFKEQIKYFIDNPNKINEQKNKTISIVEQFYNWDKITEQYCELFK